MKIKKENKMADCVKLYFELSDSVIFDQLEAVTISDFYRWNTTCLGNLIVAASGYNGL